MGHQILYALVARGNVVLAESSVVSGNAHMVAHRILARLPPDDQRVSYSQERHWFHILISDGITYMCMADEGMGRCLPFGFLEDVRQRFSANYGHSASSAIAYEYNTDFSPQLTERMDFWSNNPRADSIGRLREDISEVKGIMIQNIEKVLDRGEKIDLLVNRTDALQEESFAFRRDAREVRRTFWWKNVRLGVFIAFLLLLLVYVVVALFCGPLLSGCA
uniref:Vesicle-associated membrane protein 7 n=1 Tax=Tetraselmis sp. GSL018 TaxID=582737 RepID=A0A061R962_9CHLO